MSIGEKQIELINYVKSFFKSIESSNIDSSLSGFCYCASWTESLGYAKLKYKLKGWVFVPKFCIIFLKNVLAIASHAKYIEFKNSSTSDNYDIIILSYSFKENFQTDGSFNDRYFNENSKDLPNSHWMLISMDGYIPSNLNNNITIIKNEKGAFKYNFFSLIKILASIIVDCRFTPRKIFHYLSYHSYFAKLISTIVKKELKKNNYKVILIPYEAQPSQNNVFLEAKKINKKIKTIGYNSSLLTPLPCEFVYRSGAPDLLLVHGESQVEIFKSKLNWPENKLILIKSLRFRSKKDISLSKKIFIPIAIHNRSIFINEFEKLLMQSPPNSFPRFDVKNHSTMLNSNKHLNLKKELEMIMEIYKNRLSDFSTSKNTSIFFGVTAAVFEALEKGVNVIHICGDPIFESYNEKIWPNLKVKQLSKFVFNYNLISLGKHIIFGSNVTLSRTLKTLL